MDPSGRIVIGGTIEHTPSDTRFALVRVLATGALDNSFAGDGKMTVSFGTGVPAFLYDLAIASNGDIVAVGPNPQPAFPTNDRTAIAWISANGLLNTAFSNDGILIDDSPNHTSNIAFGVAFDATGRFVTTGAAY